MSLNYLWRWQVQVSVYCAMRIPAHLGAPSVQSCCTLSISASYRIFVYGIDHKSRLVYRLCVLVGPRFVSTSPDGAGLPLHNIHSPEVLMMSTGAEFLRPDSIPGLNHILGMQYQICIMALNRPLAASYDIPW